MPKTNPSAPKSASMTIGNRAEHEAALAELQALMSVDPTPKTEAGQRLVSLVDAIEAYENLHYPL
jgi:antitoxin component HigA of HigAB toxin-antitoxin module